MSSTGFALLTALLGLGAIAGAFLFAAWLFKRQERKADMQLVAELEKLQTLMRAVADHAAEMGAVHAIDIRADEQAIVDKALDPADPDKAFLDAITARAKKKDDGNN